MTRALRSVMTSAALTLGGLKAAPAVTTGVSLTPGHWFSAVVRTATRHARCDITNQQRPVSHPPVKPARQRPRTTSPFWRMSFQTRPERQFSTMAMIGP